MVNRSAAEASMGLDRSATRFCCLAALLATLAGCTGRWLEEGGPDEEEEIADDATPAPIRRLSNGELANAIEQLTGARPEALSMLPGDVADARALFFPGIAGRQPLARIDTWVAIADQAAEAMRPEDFASIAPSCEASDARACGAELAEVLGRRAFRRPISDDERAALLALYDDAGEHEDGLRQIVRAILLSPSFAYVIERGTAVADHPGLFSLGDREIATRLSLALCDQLPDAELMAAADAGELHTPEQIRAQAERIFALPCARVTVERFFDFWLGLEHVRTIERDADAFPELDDALRASMLAETHLFLAHEVWDERAPLADLFRADFAFVDAELGALYGIDVSSATPVRVALPPERRGLLTQAAILTHEQGEAFTRPIQRSVYVLRRLLCVDLPPPPPSVDSTPRSSEPGSTTRATYESLTASGSCASCHRTVINPVGFAFEDFDALGAHRDTERGQPIDASGGIFALDVHDLYGGAAVGLAVAELDEIHSCFARQWLRYTLSRTETRTDGTSLRTIADASRSGAPLAEVMLSVVDTFAFRHRAVPAP
jgi:hypothetical protein